jgi:hypothetical protein
MAGLIREGESKSARIPGNRMIGSPPAILNGRGSLGPCFDALRVFFALSIVTFNWEACAFRMPSIGTHPGSVSSIVVRDAFDVRFNWRAWGVAGEQEVPEMEGYDR